MEQPDFKKELKRPLEDTDGNTTGYRTFSDAQLLQELGAMRERITKLKDPLDTIESELNIEEFGASIIDAEEMKKSEVKVLENQILDLEEEIKRRNLLN